MTSSLRVSIVGELKSYTFNNELRRQPVLSVPTIAPCGILTSVDVQSCLKKFMPGELPDVTAIFNSQVIALMFLRPDRSNMPAFKQMRMITGQLKDVVATILGENSIFYIVNGVKQFRDGDREMLENYQQLGNYLARTPHLCENSFRRLYWSKPKKSINEDRLDYAMSKKEARKSWDEGNLLTVMYGDGYCFFVKPSNLYLSQNIFHNTIRVDPINFRSYSFDDQVDHLKKIYSRVLYTTKSVDEYINKHGVGN